jgi:outer membrane protein OmpA-like peptidoglycan-associated protein
MAIALVMLGLLMGLPLARADDSTGLGPPKKSYQIYFSFGTAELREEGKAVVDAAADVYKEESGQRVDVVGHTDTGEADAKTWANYKADPKVCDSASHDPVCIWKKPNADGLGLLRAKVIAARLVADGIPRTAIHIASVGTKNLMIPTGAAEREPLNRVGEIQIR